MRRPARLESARSWIATGAAGRQVRVGDFVARYGVDRYTAYQEMVMLEVPIAPGDQKYAVRPPPRPRTRRKALDPDLRPPQIIEWCGHLMMVIGWTEGGAPYGLGEEELEEIYSPEEIERMCGDPL